MEEHIDARITKTQSSIKNAFIELLDEVGFSKINVRKITERAKVNRSTFYAHYLDKYDLLDKIENELITGLNDIEEMVSYEYLQDCRENDEFLLIHLKRIVKFLYVNGQIISLLLSEKGDPAFSAKLLNLVTSIWKDNNITDRFSVPSNYVSAAVWGMISGLLLEWIKSDFKETQDEFMQIVLKMMKDIPRNIVERNEVSSNKRIIR